MAENAHTEGMKVAREAKRWRIAGEGGEQVGSDTSSEEGRKRRQTEKNGDRKKRKRERERERGGGKKERNVEKRENERDRWQE